MISIGDRVKLKSGLTDSTYIVREIYHNFKNVEWAVCENLETQEMPEHPINDLVKVQ